MCTQKKGFTSTIHAAKEVCIPQCGSIENTLHKGYIGVFTKYGDCNIKVVGEKVSLVKKETRIHA